MTETLIAVPCNVMIILIAVPCIAIIIFIVNWYRSRIKTKEFDNILIHLSTTVNVYRYIHSFHDSETGRQIKEDYSQDTGLSFILLSRHRLITQTYICSSLMDYLCFNHLDKTAVQRLICFYNKHKVNCTIEPSLFYKHLYKCYYHLISDSAADFLQNHQNFVIGSGHHQSIPEPVSSDSKSTSYYWFRLIDLNFISPDHIDPSLYCFLSPNVYSQIQELLSMYPEPNPPVYTKPKPQFKKQKQESKVVSQSTCCICLDKEPNIIFMSCFHFVTCQSCSNNIETCPICRLKINKKQIVYK